MVFQTICLLKEVSKKINRKFTQQFVDSVRLTIKAGHGGHGLEQYGGVGGAGGNVVFVANETATFKSILKRFPTKKVAAAHGEDSSKIRLLGRKGDDQIIEVPVGVSVIGQNGANLGDLNSDGVTCTAAKGGAGGWPGNKFISELGERNTVKLDLKLIADVGLVGFPNAGKSTLLKAISNAKPRIASYPFTTIRPQLGMIEYDNLRQISIADLPGLIEGAHANIGMGHKFLKHIERTKLLLLVVDVFGFQLSPQHHKRSNLENVLALNKELELYDKSLLNKPSILLVNKLDKEGSDRLWQELKPKLDHLEDHIKDCPKELRPNKVMKFDRIVPMSAKHSQNLEEVRRVVYDVLDQYEEERQKAVSATQFIDMVKERGTRLA